MKWEDMVILCKVYETVNQLEKIVAALQGDVYVSESGVGIIGKLTLIEKVILHYTVEELKSDCINDTYCTARYILNDKTLTAEEKVMYLTGALSIAEYQYKIE